MSLHVLYLVLERGRWRQTKISAVTRKKPTLPRPTEQATVRLMIDIPDGVFEPRSVTVDIKPEHIVHPVAKITATSVGR